MAFIADSPPFLARRWPGLPSLCCFCVVERDEVGIQIAVLVSSRHEVPLQMVVHWPEPVVII
jgi:hypothetical protein